MELPFGTSTHKALLDVNITVSVLCSWSRNEEEDNFKKIVTDLKKLFEMNV